MIKHFIWDFDGTLFDSYPQTVTLFQEILQKHKIEDSYNNILSFFLISEQTAIDYYINTYNLNSSITEEFLKGKKDLDLSFVKPFPYAKEICTEIKDKGYDNYIYTHRGSTAIDILKNNDMLHLFTEVVTVDNGFKRKPDPEAVFYLIDKYNIQPEEALVIGDREFEVLLGKNANTNVCFYNSGNITLNNNCNPDYTISSLKELCKIIK